MSFSTEEVDLTGSGTLIGIEGDFTGSGTLSCEEWDLTIEPETMEGTLNVGGGLIKKVSKNVGLAGPLNIAGVLTIAKTIARTFEGTLVIAGTLTKKAKKISRTGFQPVWTGCNPVLQTRRS